MKKLFSFVLVITLVLGVTAFVTAIQPITVKVDGKQVAFPDAQPFIDENNRTLVPVRFVAENLGCMVDWEDVTQVVSITRDSLRIVLKIDENWAVVNDARKEFDTKAVLKEDRTFVPLRFVSEALGKEVNWHGSTRTVAIGVDNDFELVEASGVMPEGFIQPRFRVVHNLDSNRYVYFFIEFVNGLSYKDKEPQSYSYKIECLNYPELNLSQSIRPDGTSGQIINNTEEISLNLIFLPFINPNMPTYISSLPHKYYTTIEKEKYFTLHSGMEITYKIIFKKGTYKQIYTKTVKI